MKKKEILRRFAPLLAGAFFFCSAFFLPCVEEAPVCAVSAAAAEAWRVPRGVTVDGVPVGGMSVRKAEGLLRGLTEAKNPVLTVHTPAGDFEFSGAQIGFSDDFSRHPFPRGEKRPLRREGDVFFEGHGGTGGIHLRQ